MYSVTRKRKIGIQVGCAAVDRKEKVCSAHILRAVMDGVIMKLEY